MGKKILVITGVIFILIVIAVLGVYYYSINFAFYKPGNLQNTAIEVPSQNDLDQNYWRMDDEVKLYYFTQGQGATPVLIIHGGPGVPPAGPWPNLEELSKYKFYYYHQRGCGQSTRPIYEFKSQNYYQNLKELNQHLGLAKQLEDIERIRQILKQDKLILIGHSYGGFLATLYAVEFPDHVAKMILISPADLFKMPIDDEYNLFKIIEDALNSEQKQNFISWQKKYFDFKNIFQKNEADLVILNNEYTAFYQIALENNKLTFPQAAATDPKKNGGFMVQAMYLSLGRKYDYRQKLVSINIPVLILRGENELNSLTGQQYANYLPEAKIKTIPGAGHFSFFEQPKEFVKLIKVFLYN